VSREGNPAYAATARVQQVKLDDITRDSDLDVHHAFCRCLLLAARLKEQNCGHMAFPSKARWALLLGIFGFIAFVAIKTLDDVSIS
jgi:hypothetical protein